MAKSFRTEEERKRVVLAAGARRLRKSQIDWIKGVTFDDLTEDTGIDRSQIAKDFDSKKTFEAELIDYCLDPANLEAEWTTDLAGEVAKMLTDPTLPLGDAWAAIGAADDEYHEGDQDFVGQMAIWALAFDDPRAKQKLKELYKFFDQAHVDAWNAAVESLAEVGVTPRPGITGEELVAILSAVAEGVAIRAAVDPELVPAGLTGKAMSMLVECLLTSDTEPSELGSGLRSIDELRKA